MMSSYSTHLATFSVNVTRCYDVAKNATTATIGFSIWTVRVYISRSRHFLNVNLPSLTIVKTVWHWKCRLFGWPIKWQVSEHEIIAIISVFLRVPCVCYLVWFSIDSEKKNTEMKRYKKNIFMHIYDIFQFLKNILQHQEIKRRDICSV